MMRTPARVWLGLALLLLAVAIPAYADTDSDIRALFFQASNTANAAGFNQGERVSLVAKVVEALRASERGNETSVEGHLGAFINEVQALERSGRLAPEDAQPLIDSANAIVGEL
jgi:hypothetical protein